MHEFGISVLSIQKTILSMNTIKLSKCVTHLMLPFRLGSGWALNTTNFEDDIWTKTDEDIHNFDFLLEHVRDFFVKNYTKGKEDEAACVIVGLKKDALPVKMFNNKKQWLSNKPFNIEKKPGKSYRRSSRARRRARWSIRP